MFCVIGYTRFPVYFSDNGRKILGGSPPGATQKIKDYIKSLGKQRGVVILGAEDIRFKNRFVIGSEAINPILDLTESVPNRIFVYPDTRYEKPLDGIYGRGVILKGVGRMPLFIPLICMRHLERVEANALSNTVQFEKIGIDRMLEFGRQLGIAITSRELANSVALTIQDNEIRNGDAYQVLVDSEGRALETNVCFDIPGNMFLPEFIVQMRQEGHLVIYERRW